MGKPGAKGQILLFLIQEQQLTPGAPCRNFFKDLV